MKNRKNNLLRSAAIVASLTLALLTNTSQAADYVKGYTQGSSSQLLKAGGGNGTVLFVDEAATGNQDQTANGGNPLWGWEIDGSASWSSGDNVKFTGIAMPFWTNNNATSSNTQNALHKVKIYSCGPDNTYNGTNTAGTNDDTLLATVEVNFTLEGQGVSVYRVNFDTPVDWASVDSEKIFFHIEAVNLPADPAGTRALRYKSGTAGAAAKLKSRTTGNNLTAGGVATTRLSIAGTVNEKVWEGDGNATADWDTSSMNWDDNTSTYADGDTAIFDNTYDGISNTVNLTAALAPESVSVSSTSYTFNGIGGLTGSMSLSRSGGGTLTLANSGSNDYTGDTVLTNGTIELGADGVLSGSSVLRIGGGGTSKLKLDGFDAEIGGLQSVGSNTRVIENNTLGSILTINVADTESYNYTSNFTGTAGATSVAKTGLGTQIFTRVQGYTVDVLDVSADAGTLIWNVKGNIGTVTVASGATLQIGNASTGGGVGSGVTNGAGSAGDGNIANEGEVAFARTDAVTYSGVISGSGDVSFNNNIALTLDTAQTYSGDTFVEIGTLTATAADQLSPDSVLRIGGTSGGTSAVEMSGFDQTIAGLIMDGGNGRVIRNNGGSTATLTIDIETGESYIYGANLAGSATIDIVKEGLGTQNMTRNNYSTNPGSITVNAGTLDWFVNDTYGALAVNDTATLGLDRTGTAASFSAASGSTTNYNVAITDWTGVAGTDWPSITTTGDFTADVGSTFNVIVTDGVTNFTEANKTFVIGTVGGTASLLGTIAVDDSGFTAGTGTWGLAVNGSDLELTYTAGATDPYDAWATSQSLTAPNDGRTDDKDNDGIANELEWVLGGDPLVSDTDILPTSVKSGTDLIFTFDRADDTIGEVILTVRYGSDLVVVGWTDAVVPTTTSGIFTITDNGATDEVVATIPIGVATEQFVRLETSPAP